MLAVVWYNRFGVITMLKPSEMLEEKEAGVNLVKGVMRNIKKRDWIVAVLVPGIIILNVKMLEFLPDIFNYVIVWFMAKLKNLSYKTAKDIWSMPDWMNVVRYYFVPCIVMVAVGFLECWCIVKSTWYRIAGCCLIVIYMLSSWIGLFPLKRSADRLVAGNYVFIPVLLIYMLVGIVYSFYKWDLARDRITLKIIIISEQHLY